jgi:SpoIIAA-like
MSAEIVGVADGTLTLKIAGKLAYPELRSVQKSATEIISKQGKIRILVLGEGFQGWEKEGDWGNLSFQNENDARIEKMAIVCEKKWEDLSLMFVGKGLRKFPVEYFQPADLAKARAWLA